MAAPVAGEDRRGMSLAGAEVELRDAGGSERFYGHGSVFDQRTSIGNPLSWGFYEEVAPGAFSKTITEQDVRMLIDHDPFYVVSRMSAGTLTLAEDATGLVVDSALDTGLSYVSDLKVNLRNGNITGMSIGFYVQNDDWWTEDIETTDGNKVKVEVRRITEIKLLETSAVTFPAFPQTDAGVRDESRVRPWRPEDEVRSVGLALAARPDGNAMLEARARWQPGLNDYRVRDVVQIKGFHGQVLREDDTTTPDPSPIGEPAATTPPGDEGTEGAPADDGAPIPDVPSGPTDIEGEPAASTPSRGMRLRRLALDALRPAS